LKRRILLKTGFVVAVMVLLLSATVFFVFTLLNENYNPPDGLVVGLGAAGLISIITVTLFFLKLNTHLQTSKEQIKENSIQLEQEAEQLWEIRERYRALMDNTILGVAVMKTDHTIIEVNSKFSKLFKKKTGDFVGNYCYNEFEKRDAICPHCPGREAIATGKTVEVLTQGVLDDGKIFYAWNRAFPFYDRKGVIKGFIEIVEDVTKQKVAEDELKKAFKELQQLQDQLIHSEKMASIGQLAAGVAHEINTPTAFIASNLSTMAKYMGDIETLLIKYTQLFEQLLENNKEDINHIYDDITKTTKKMPLDFILEDMQEAIKESLEGTGRISKIVQALRTFSNIDGKEYISIDINEGIESSLIIAQNQFKENNEVLKELSPLPQIKCYPQEINQVILNLLINAIHATEEEGAITIRSYHDVENVYVQISDTGKGIEPEHLRKIFDPFFTTKDVGKGPGLGLSTSYNIIKKHKGEIRVESELGKGTCFTIVLPQVP